MLRDSAAKSSLSWCVIGDFNDIVSMKVKREARIQPWSLLESFSEAINSCGLDDLCYTGDLFI